MLTVRSAIRSIADLALPRVCVICGRTLNLTEETICICCQADLPLTHFWEMSRNPMADKFNSFVAGSPDTEGKERYCYAAALVYYKKDSDYRHIPQSLKYRADLKSGRHFAGMLADRLASAPWFADVDTVVPVPLLWRRKWRRGYNQAEVIARAVASRLGAEVLDILVRRRATSTQTKLDTEARAANVKGAFKMSGRKIKRQPGHLLLIDDVFTSGATAHECYCALRDRFGYEVRISVATLAYASD